MSPTIASKPRVRAAQLPRSVRQDTEWVHVLGRSAPVDEDFSLARFNLSIPAGITGARPSHAADHSECCHFY